MQRILKFKIKLDNSLIVVRSSSPRTTSFHTNMTEYNIKVITPAGKEVDMPVQEQWTIMELKQHMSLKFMIDYNRKFITLNDVKKDDKTTLKEAEISEGCTIKVLDKDPDWY
ncbi:hypothetical protein BLNAU_460 [Blattamonas nauphoetae]|uniref:Ubiquitin-like domain-containing protein n=1 Tax=Blattamonas nauphoetae TaxID=2049346 RepID=A0ABQ9YLB1_9EUKA|nr:hypothetical protein BLNAU_460 [Blattamonas nauphoetae]